MGDHAAFRQGKGAVAQRPGPVRSQLLQHVTTSPSATASTGHGAMSCRPERRSLKILWLWGERAPLVDRDFEAFQLSVEVRALYTEHPCSVGNTTAVLIKRGGNVLALEPGARLAQGSPGG